MSGASSSSTTAGRVPVGWPQLDDALADADDRTVADAGLPERLLGHMQPAAAADHDRLAVGEALLADPAVAHMDDAVGDLAGGRVMADDQRRRAGVSRELAKQVEHAARGHLVELAGGLVGDEQRGSVHERGAEGDPLLLAAGQLARQ